MTPTPTDLANRAVADHDYLTDIRPGMSRQQINKLAAARLEAAACDWCEDNDLTLESITTDAWDAALEDLVERGFRRIDEMEAAEPRDVFGDMADSAWDRKVERELMERAP